MAPIVRALRERPTAFTTRVCVSGQHHQMVDRVLSLFAIQSDIDLSINLRQPSLAVTAAAILNRLDPILELERPDWVLVQGDTTTVAAAAMAAHYRRIPLGHVEAGLRTGDKGNPFPEEFNRRVAAVAADLHFAPTPRAKHNLLREGIEEQAIIITGNPVIDSLLWMTQQPPKAGARSWKERFGGNDSARVLLVTAHRRENWGAPLSRICQAIREIADSYRDRVHIIFPVHPNPEVHDRVHRELGNQSRVTLTPPLEYDELVEVLGRSYLVLTDSGGLQEEGPSLGKPVLVLRETTERPEAVEAGTIRLVGTDPKRIVAETRRLLDDDLAYAAMARVANPYGDGHAAQRIADALEDDSEPTGGQFPDPLLQQRIVSAPSSKSRAPAMLGTPV